MRSTVFVCSCLSCLNYTVIASPLSVPVANFKCRQALPIAMVGRVTSTFHPQSSIAYELTRHNPLIMSEIEPLVHTFKSITYTFAGEGLRKDGHAYDANPEKLIHKDGKTNSKDAPIEKKSVAWWKAQCAFRGLNQSGSISDLQLRIRESKKKILPELKDAEKELAKEYKKLSKQAGEDKWTNLKTAEQKARSDADRYLREAFPESASGRPVDLDIVEVKIADRQSLASAARKLGLETVLVDAPSVGGKKPSPAQWIIVGRTRDAVWNQKQSIEQGVPSSNKASMTAKANFTKSQIPGTSQNLSKKAEEKVRPKSNARALNTNAQPPAAKKAKVEPHSEPEASSTLPRAPRTKQTARKSAAEEELYVPQSNWEVAGRYSISCPYIEGEWDIPHRMRLDLYLQGGVERQQLFAVFDFGVLTGIMRFQKPAPIARAKSIKSDSGNVSIKRPWDEYDSDGDVSMGGLDDVEPSQSERSSYQERDFHLSTKDVPTARKHTWPYRWRGEMGLNEPIIEPHADQYVQYIKFCKKGEEISGQIVGDSFRGPCSFTGVKIRTEGLRKVDPDYEWSKLSEAEYERRRVDRWR